MVANQPTSGKAAVEQLSAFIVDQMKAGADRTTITANLVAQGLQEPVAEELVERAHARAAEIAEAERLTLAALLPALAGGLIAALIGGVAWGFIGKLTGYEIGWVAWGVGFLAGFGVVSLAGGRRGVPLQVVAVAAALVGVAIGKYITFFYALRQYVAGEYGAEASAEMSMMSAGVAQFFVENATAILSGYDALWIFFAAATAWSIPKARALRLAASDEGS